MHEHTIEMFQPSISRDEVNVSNELRNCCAALQSEPTIMLRNHNEVLMQRCAGKAVLWATIKKNRIVKIFAMNRRIGRSPGYYYRQTCAISLCMR